MIMFKFFKEFIPATSKLHTRQIKTKQFLTFSNHIITLLLNSPYDVHVLGTMYRPTSDSSEVTGYSIGYCCLYPGQLRLTLDLATPDGCKAELTQLAWLHTDVVYPPDDGHPSQY